MSRYDLWLFLHVAGTIVRVAQEGPSPELAARVRSTTLVARVFLGLLFVIVFVMVVKPW